MALAEVLAAADSTAAGLAATVFIADTGVASTAGTAAAFTAGMVASIRATMGMAIPSTVITATDRVQLAAGTRQLCHEAKAPPAGRGFGFSMPYIFILLLEVNTSARRCRPILNPSH